LSKRWEGFLLGDLNAVGLNFVRDRATEDALCLAPQRWLRRIPNPATAKLLSLMGATELPGLEHSMAPNCYPYFDGWSLNVSGYDDNPWPTCDHNSREPATRAHAAADASADEARLVDVFAPPRADFSLKPGSVLNADEYAVPSEIQSSAVMTVANISSRRK